MSVEGEQPNWGVEHNPHGSWANLENKKVQSAILKMATKNHTACVAKCPEYAQLSNFLDAFTSAWLAQKAQVEQEALRHGFAPCEDTAILSPSERQQTAILCLTLNGSNILLGNGCLSAAGGFGRYARIPLREKTISSILQVSRGVCVVGDAKLYQKLYCRNFRNEFEGVSETSSLQLLFYTTNTLSDDLQQIIAAMLDESIIRFNDTLLGVADETKSVGIHIPEEVPELV